MALAGILFFVIMMPVNVALTDDSLPFTLSLRRDIPVAVVAAATALAGDHAVSNMTPPDIRGLDRGDVNSFDRFACDYYSKKVSSWSDATRDMEKGLFILALAPHIFGEGGVAYHEIVTDVVMYIEATALITGMTQTAKGVFERPRPYVFNDEVAEGTRQRNDSFKSFWSGHTSYTFMSAVFTGYVFGKRHPQSRWKKAIWIGGLGLAAATGTFRVRSGNHYPTDVLASAAAGSLVGWLIPRLHESGSERIALDVFGVSGITCTVAF